MPSRIHFYNTPITKNFSDASHPLNIIRSIFQPGDFIAIKLDIDDGPLETAIMKEIESDPLLMSAIAEMMFEQHYDHEGGHVQTHVYHAFTLGIRVLSDCCLLPCLPLHRDEDMLLPCHRYDRLFQCGKWCFSG